MEPNLCYVDGKTCYVDYCCTDELSKLELGNMLAEMGVEGDCNYYYSCTGVDSCEFLQPITVDRHALELGLFESSISCRISSVFIDHEMLPFAQILWPPVDENLGFYGDMDDITKEWEECGKGSALKEGEGCSSGVDGKGSELQDGEGCSRGVDGKGSKLQDGEGCSRGMDGKGSELKDGEGCSMGLEDIIEYDSGESDDANSLGSDSDHSEYLGDTDGNYDLDNKEFDEHIDSDEEWGGLKEQKRRDGSSIPEFPMREVGGSQGPRHVFHQKQENKPVDLELGMCFTDADDFRRTVRMHAINLGRELHFPINNKFKVQAKCKNDKCEWLVYASRVKADDTFRIKTIHDKHKCPRLKKVVHANSNFLAEKYMRDLRSNPKWPVRSMMEMLKDENKIYFSRWQIYRCKGKVARVANGDVNDQYKFIWSYAEEILKTNPGTTVKIKCKDLGGGKTMFKRFYCCWDALKRGLLDGCRRVICLDGCHLKSTQGGVILSAVGIDANNGIYPFAYAVVEKEKKKSWAWFLDLIVRDLDIQNSALWTVMYDKQKGLVEAVNQLLPHSEHRFCVMHLYSNFKLVHRGLALKDILWKAARATRVVDFNKAMQSMKDRNVQAFEWLQKRDPKHWSRSHFSTINNTDLLYNNLSESFNSMILDARPKPILKMLEEIRLLLMLRIGARRAAMLKHNSLLCPIIEEILDANKEKSHSFSATWNGHDEFSVTYSSTVAYKVHIGEHTCSCRRWQLTGIPCPHAISGMYQMGYNPEDFVANWYKTETCLRTYSHFMHPLSSQDEWPIPEGERSEIIPPKPRSMPGRPKKHNRKLQPDEKPSQQGSQNPSQRGSKKANPKKFGRLGRNGLIITCKTCGVMGHNSRTCGQKKGEGLDIPATSTDNPKRNKKEKAGITIGSTSSIRSHMTTRARANVRDEHHIDNRKGKQKVNETSSMAEIEKEVPNKPKLQVKGKDKINVTSAKPVVKEASCMKDTRNKAEEQVAKKPKLQVRGKGKAADHTISTSQPQSATFAKLKQDEGRSLSQPNSDHPLDANWLNGLRTQMMLRKLGFRG